MPSHHGSFWLVRAVFCSVADPEGSETFGRIRSGTEKNVLDPDSNPDPKLEPYFLAEIRWWLHDYTYFTFTSSSNNCCTVEKITSSCTQCCGSVTFWYRSRSADPCLDLNPDLDPDPKPDPKLLFRIRNIGFWLVPVISLFLTNCVRACLYI